MDSQNQKPLIVGNWKMNQNVTDSIKLVTTLKNMIGENLEVEAVIAPPYTSLYSISIAIQETPLKLAAQNCHWEESGAYTGEVSADFLKDAGCDYVILGHSERRAQFGETDEMINKKVHAALNCEITPILCIGETSKERKSEKTLAVLETQLRRGLMEVNMSDLTNFAIAYEPVWAIGTGDTANPYQIAEAHAYIRNLLGKLYDSPTASGVRLLYGGSVRAENAPEILQINHVDGVLVGGASLNPEQFSKMLQYREVLGN